MNLKATAALVVLLAAVGLFFLRQQGGGDAVEPASIPQSEKSVEATATPPEKPEVKPEADADADLALPIDQSGLAVKDLRRQGRYVLGVVTDPYGTPVPRARIQAIPDDGGPPHDAVGKDDGSFYIMAPSDQAHTLVIEVAGVPTLEVIAP